MMFRAPGLWSAALLCATMLAPPAPASPQGYPARPIKLVVRFRLHRSACKREEKPCQLGAVHTWRQSCKWKWKQMMTVSGARRSDST